MSDKINSEIIKTENDILIMLDNLLEKRDNEWWISSILIKRSQFHF